MKVTMSQGEEYPVFGVGVNHPQHQIEVPDELLARWKEAEEQWQATQLEMAHYYYLCYPDIYTQYQGEFAPRK